MELSRRISSLSIQDRRLTESIGRKNFVMPLKDIQFMSVSDYEAKMQNYLFATYPLTFKIEHLLSGDVLYQAIIKFDPPNQAILCIEEHADPVHVYVDKVLHGTFTVEPMIDVIQLEVAKGQVIELLVEDKRFKSNGFYISDKKSLVQLRNANPLYTSNQQFAPHHLNPNAISFSYPVPMQQESCPPHFLNQKKNLDKQFNMPGAKKQFVEFYSTRYKTELCRSVWENRVCMYGFKCLYAHSREELRVPIRHPKYKTRLCNKFHTTGFCSYGSRCHFIHSIEQDKKLVLNFSNAVHGQNQMNLISYLRSEEEPSLLSNHCGSPTENCFYLGAH